MMDISTNSPSPVQGDRGSHRALVVDTNACAGHGLCYGAANDLLDSDDEGYPVVLDNQIPADLFELADQIVDMCPERALTVVTCAADSPLKG